MQVDLVEMLGAERLVHGRIGAHEVVVRIDAGAPAPAAGGTWSVQASPDQLHVFDVGTGVRVDGADA
jgi:sn-glycerol 3-phosphate transport system ATP-binding protein